MEKIYGEVGVVSLKRAWDSGFGITVFIFNEFSEANGLRYWVWVKNGQFSTNIWVKTRDKAIENNIWGETQRAITKFLSCCSLKSDAWWLVYVERLKRSSRAWMKDTQSVRRLFWCNHLNQLSVSPFMWKATINILCFRGIW